MLNVNITNVKYFVEIHYVLTEANFTSNVKLFRQITK